MPDQGSSAVRCGQLLPNVLPMVWEFGKAHQLSNNVKALSKPAARQVRGAVLFVLACSEGLQGERNANASRRGVVSGLSEQHAPQGERCS